MIKLLFLRSNEYEMMDTILNHGPVVVGYAVYYDFLYYRRGVYYHSGIHSNLFLIVIVISILYLVISPSRGVLHMWATHFLHLSLCPMTSQVISDAFRSVLPWSSSPPSLSRRKTATVSIHLFSVSLYHTQLYALQCQLSLVMDLFHLQHMVFWLSIHLVFPQCNKVAVLW